MRYAVTTHCKLETDKEKLRPVDGRAMPTTVESMAVIADPSTVAVKTQRPGPLDSRSSTGSAEGFTPPATRRPPPDQPRRRKATPEWERSARARSMALAWALTPSLGRRAAR